MVNAIAHRGPDEGAFWVSHPFFFGHRRLSIIDIGMGGQPMATDDGRYVITYNGEIYNFIELRQDLQKLGYIFRTTSDTEVLLHGYRQWSTDLPSKLVGMFAFAIADTQKKEIFLARDRFGEKPLFYHRKTSYFAFASELKPLCMLPDIPKELDLRSLGSYLSLNYVPGDATLMKSIKRLLPAHWALVGQRKFVTRRYWDPSGVKNNSVKGMRDALEEFVHLFDQSVKVCLRSDVPVGIFLSGGMDSSLVAESAARQGRLSHAYFIDFEEISYSERNAAELISHRLNLPLVRTVLTSKCLDKFMDIVDHADDPLADSSAVNVWHLSEAASVTNKVVLGGDGGDELFGGYMTYRATRLHQKWISCLPCPMRKFLAREGSRIKTSEKKVSFSYKLRRFVRAAALDSELAHVTFNGTWLPGEAARFANDDRTRLIFEKALCEQMKIGGEKSLSLKDLQIIDLSNYLPNDILAKVDRMSMAHGLEVRAPFLDYRLAEWALGLSENLKLNGSVLKVLLRKRAGMLWGPEIADRPKLGFSIPIHSWVRHQMRDLIEDLLSPDSLRKIDVLSFTEVQKVLKEHMSGARSWGFEIWGLAVMVAWHRLRIQGAEISGEENFLIERKFPQASL